MRVDSPGLSFLSHAWHVLPKLLLASWRVRCVGSPTAASAAQQTVFVLVYDVTAHPPP